MPLSTFLAARSLKWPLLALLLVAGIVLALVLGPETTPLVTLEGGLAR